MKGYKKQFIIILILYYINELLVSIFIDFDYQIIVRSVLGLILFYFLYLFRKWAVIISEILFGISLVVSLYGFFYLDINNEIIKWILLYQVYIYGYILYIIYTIKNRNLQRKEKAKDFLYDVGVGIYQLVDIIFVNEGKEYKINLMKKLLVSYVDKEMFWNNIKSKVSDDFLYEDLSSFRTPADLFIFGFLVFSEAKGYCNYIDWKEDNDSVRWKVNNILSKYKLGTISLDESFFDFKSDNYLETYELLEKYAEELNKRELVLLELGRGNDAYDICIIKKEDYQKISDINNKLNCYIQTFT